MNSFCGETGRIQNEGTRETTAKCHASRARQLREFKTWAARQKDPRRKQAA